MRGGSNSQQPPPHHQSPFRPRFARAAHSQSLADNEIQDSTLTTRKIRASRHVRSQALETCATPRQRILDPLAKGVFIKSSRTTEMDAASSKSTRRRCRDDQGHQPAKERVATCPRCHGTPKHGWPSPQSASGPSGCLPEQEGKEVWTYAVPGETSTETGTSCTIP